LRLDRRSWFHPVMATVAMLGAGSWGTALAVHLARLDHDVRLWARNPDAVGHLAESRRHPSHPAVDLPPRLAPTSDLAAACRDADAVVVACPSHAVRELTRSFAWHTKDAALIVSTAKGVETESRLTMSAVLEQVLPGPLTGRVSVLSGPSFAREVAQSMPTAVTAAARLLSVAEELQALFAGPTFRVYTSTDTVGVQIGAAVKNVIALAAGVSDGLGFGSNTRAALITRGLAEISRLAMHLGAERATLAGLAGLGDLVLTCTGDLSRNRQVGLRLGRGEKLASILASMSEVAEGVRNTASVHDLARGVGVDMPITEQMFLLLYEGKEPMQAVVDLMSRRRKHELD
jgi:glycerol-3-phosphate dehydrogenase (NAD(P)+)